MSDSGPCLFVTAGSRIPRFTLARRPRSAPESTSSSRSLSHPTAPRFLSLSFSSPPPCVSSSILLMVWDSAPQLWPFRVLAPVGEAYRREGDGRERPCMAFGDALLPFYLFPPLAPRHCRAVSRYVLRVLLHTPFVWVLGSCMWAYWLVGLLSYLLPLCFDSVK